MGSFFYDSDVEPIDMPDELLAHVRLVAATKLRRGESFMMSWRHPDDHPVGRSSIWLQPSIPLRFVFDSPEADDIDPGMLRQLSLAANSPGGLLIALDEPLVRVDASEPRTIGGSPPGQE